MDRILVRTPVQLISVIAFYLFFIYKLGPNFMKERKTFDLKKILIGYNILQIFVNLGIFIMVSAQNNHRKLLTPEFTHQAGTYLRNQNFLCIPSDKSESPEATLAVRVHYSYLLLKYFDLVETVRSIELFYAPADRNV
jgi:elongation of very long chain fatty acids protein 7